MCPAFLHGTQAPLCHQKETGKFNLDPGHIEWKQSHKLSYTSGCKNKADLNGSGRTKGAAISHHLDACFHFIIRI